MLLLMRPSYSSGGVTPPPIVVVGPGPTGGSSVSDDGEWIQQEPDTRQRRATFNDLKQQIWDENQKPAITAPAAAKPKKVAPQKRPNELLSDEELLSAWWLMRN